MLEKYIPKRFANAMIKHVIAASLFFPYFYSHNDNYYYQDFVLPNFFAVLAIVFIFTSWKLEFKRNAIFVTGLSILLVAYNVFATYMNVKYHHWYGEQINTTIAFLFFIVLLLVKDTHALIDSSTIKATIHMIVASNVLSIIFRLCMGYNGIRLQNNWISMIDRSNTSLADQYFWLYGHKSEYGLMLVLGVAFCVVYRKQFRNILTYVLSLGVLFVALYLSDSYTAMGAALLIFVGQFLDYLWTAKWWKKLIAAVIIPLPLLGIAIKLLESMDENRNILTLGNRIPIWKTFTALIQQYPNGIDSVFGIQLFAYKDWRNYSVRVNNCHNVFLNHMFRFSILVGGIFCAIFILIILFSIKRNFNCLPLFIWVALLIPMTMDYAFTTIELPTLLLIIFFIFYLKTSPQKRSTSITNLRIL